MQINRLRRLREKSCVRDWISQTKLMAEDIILPYFVVDGKGIREPIESMPGIYHLSVDKLLKDIAEIKGLKCILLFGLPKTKDEKGSEAFKKGGVVQKAVSAVKKEFRELVVITDVCLCGYTSHGHCGIIKSQKSKLKTQNCRIDNDETIKVLAKIAISYADSGADFVAPSAMMDGQVKVIRDALDKNGLNDTGILAYSSKFASSFYAPFREALDSTPQFGDRKSYQMDYRNSDEALREVEQDIREGADILMVKPALAYLDIIYRVKERFNLPLAAYSVSGEYAMIKNISKDDSLKEKDLVFEILTSIKRAGADFIITYFGKEVLGWLNQK